MTADDINALNNVLNERDQLLKDLQYEIKKHDSCDFCKHQTRSAAECKGCTHDNNQWEWRGVKKGIG